MNTYCYSGRFLSCYMFRDCFVESEIRRMRKFEVKREREREKERKEKEKMCAAR